ncbi:MAG: FimB/Mfa2 family fimbrial subunit [Porphyromonas endodontalis]|uniref:FimB/Mfa2 family fimbrial subunit n=1 Tax=Porphyromonas endodontalis TaxID=28124 RepID=UPI003622A501
MKFLQRIIPLLLLALVATSCNGLIYEQGDDCPTLLRFTPYVQTPCMEDPAYPQGVDRMTVVVFNKGGKLLGYKTFKDVTLSDKSIFEIALPENKEEVYRCFFWAGDAEEDYTYIPEVSKLPTLAEATFGLKLSANGRPGNKLFHTLYHGKINVRNADSHIEGASTVLYSKPLLTEYSNDFVVRVTGLRESMPCRMEIRDNNARYSMTGALASPQVNVIYAADIPSGAPRRETTLRTLRLDDAATHPELVMLRNDTGEELLHFDLKKDLLGKLPGYRPECDHLFIVDLKFSPSMAVEISINGWVVHSYDIEF